MLLRVQFRSPRVLHHLDRVGWHAAAAHHLVRGVQLVGAALDRHRVRLLAALHPNPNLDLEALPRGEAHLANRDGLVHNLAPGPALDGHEVFGQLHLEVQVVQRGGTRVLDGPGEGKGLAGHHTLGMGGVHLAKGHVARRRRVGKDEGRGRQQEEGRRGGASQGAVHDEDWVGKACVSVGG